MIDFRVRVECLVVNTFNACRLGYCFSASAAHGSEDDLALLSV